ncbi:MAG: right-handed parallel beta-helix repeat-containing protein [Marinilabiliales bacterium]|nr:right-handed parallel beta-helix repeat-containing protein [Marinilabiliales bacterium]
MKIHRQCCPAIPGRAFLFLFVVLFLNPFWSEAREWYVSPTAGPGGNGSKERPFSCLTAARDAIRAFRKEHPGSSGKGETIYLRAGIFALNESFTLEAEDGGGENDPVVYRAFPGESVSLTGAVCIRPEEIKKVEDPIFLDRIIEPAARPHLREIDLRKAGVSDTLSWKLEGFGRPYAASGVELFINGTPYRLAGYPNNGKIRIHPEDVIDPGIRNEKAYPGKIRFPDERIKKWPESGDAMVFGCFTYAWASDQLRIAAIDRQKQEITFADAHVYGISGKKEWNQYRIFNLPEEIDEPGEYYFDKSAGKLYYYPIHEPLSTDTILVSRLGSPLVSMVNTSNIRMEGISFEAARGIGVWIVDGSNNQLKDCTFRNIGMLAVRIGLGYDSFGEHQNNFNSHGGKHNGLLHCTLDNIGSGGVCLGGGDRKSLEPAGNYVDDCSFTRCGRLTYSYKCPVNIHGVGNRITHCQFNESQATEIYLHGNNHLIEYNLIQDACTFMDDQGAFYLGRNPSEAGNVIRYNLFRNTGRFGTTMAVYMDDGACGTSVYGNIFFHAGSRTIMMGGGSHNPMIANIFIGSPMAIHLDNRLENWAKDWLYKDGLFEKELKEVDYKNPPYSLQYPWLSSYFETDPKTPKSNDIGWNRFIGVQQIHNGKAAWGPVRKSNKIGKGISDPAQLPDQIWSKKELKAIRKIIPEFQPVAAEEMGRR